MKQPRRLVAVVIDDQPGRLSQAQYKDFVKLDKVQGYTDIQRKFNNKHQSTRASMVADLLLIDVNLSDNMPPDNMDWGTQPGIKPIGPLLALPFIARDLCAFAPYSNHWGNATVTDNGFVVLSVSLLLSVVSRKVIDLEKTRETIKSKAESVLVTSPQDALREALQQFRTALVLRPVQFVDIGRLHQRLSELQQTALDVKSPVTMPLRDAEGLLSVDFYLPSGEFDRVELSSLFGDKLDFVSPADPSILHTILGELESWRGNSIEKGGPTLLSAGTEILEICYEQEISVRDAAEQLRRKGHSDIDRYLLYRVAMEFAWVQAWYETLTFNERDRSMIGRVQTILGLKAQGNESNRYRRLLGETVDGKDIVSTNRWRKPFKTEFTGTNDAYQLDQNLPGTLTNIERGLCVQFAQDELRWDGTDPLYPAWMTESVESRSEVVEASESHH